MSQTISHDPIDRPAHYMGAGGLEARRVIEDAGLAPGFYTGNAIKYLLRAGRKTPDRLADLKKGRRNLAMLAEVHAGVVTNGAPRHLAPGAVAAAFGLTERLACALALLTMPSLATDELDAICRLIDEEIEDELRARLPAANAGRAA